MSWTPSSWRNHRADLMRLREAASKHLWKDLHESWLPNLVGEHPSASEFERWITAALRLAPVIRYLDSKPTRIRLG